MAVKKIFSVGFDLPGDEFEFVEFESDRTLLDADIILFEPSFGNCVFEGSFSGKPQIEERNSFSVLQHVSHWRSEIFTAAKAGRLIAVYLAKPIDAYRYTGERQYSGTGRNQRITNIVGPISSYNAVPNLKKVTAKSGKKVKIKSPTPSFFLPYWKEFSEFSPYECEIEGDIRRILLETDGGDRVLGGFNEFAGGGAIIYLPPLRYDSAKFLRAAKAGEQKGKQYWTSDAVQFGKRLAASLVSIYQSFHADVEQSAEPSWATSVSYRLDAESELDAGIASVTEEIARLNSRKEELSAQLSKAGELRRLLYAQGKPLEFAILEAMTLLGFESTQFSDGKSEFDGVFVSSEGRCIGEAEGRDTKSIHIEKFSQLERNLNEDFARDGVDDYAKGLLFGNAFRLTEPEKRGPFFTEKCLSAARRTKVSLIRTPDLFLPAKYLKANPEDTDFALRCRQAIFSANGEVVVFPTVPSRDDGLTSVASATDHASEESTQK